VKLVVPLTLPPISYFTSIPTLSTLSYFASGGPLSTPRVGKHKNPDLPFEIMQHASEFFTSRCQRTSNVVFKALVLQHWCRAEIREGGASHATLAFTIYQGF
jgi:hypothetical protein